MFAWILKVGVFFLQVAFPLSINYLVKVFFNTQTKKRCFFLNSFLKSNQKSADCREYDNEKNDSYHKGNDCFTSLDILSNICNQARIPSINSLSKCQKILAWTLVGGGLEIFVFPASVLIF